MDRLGDERLTLLGLLLESSSALRTQLDQRLARDVRLPIGSFELLVRLARSPGRHLRMSDLAAQAGLTPSGLTRAIDRLHRDGLVVRVPCPSDGRGAFAELTPAGLDRVLAGLGPHLEHVDECFTGALSPEEQRQLLGLLRKVRDHINPAAVAGIEDAAAC